MMYDILNDNTYNIVQYLERNGYIIVFRDRHPSPYYKVTYKQCAMYFYSHKNDITDGESIYLHHLVNVYLNRIIGIKNILI